MLPLKDPASRRPRATTMLGAFLIVTLLLAAWLGYEAVDAARSHRLAAEAALRDYAEIAVDALASEVEDRLDDAVDDHMFYQVSRRTGRRTLPSPQYLRSGLDDLLNDHPCDCPGLREPIALFRFSYSDRSSMVIPDTFPAAVVPGLSERLFADWYRPGRSGQGILTVPAGDLLDRDVTVAYRVSVDSLDLPRAVYGVVLRPDAFHGMLHQTFQEERLLPRAIAKDQPNDSLISATVRGPGGVVIYESPVAYSEELVSSRTLAPWLGGIEVEVVVRPDEASQLIIGGLPRSRLPFIMVLLVLTLGVGVATLILLRRQQEFQHLRDDFVSGVSHELRTPLTQIRMFAELQEGGQLTSAEDRSRAVSVIHRESRRLSHLVENLLQFSTLQRAAGRTLPQQPIDLAEAIEEGVDAVAPLLEARGTRLEMETEPGLTVLANRGALTRIVVNLLDNALKYGPDGQRVTVTVAGVEGEARLSVADEGPGVPAADRERVWRPYRRLERDVRGPEPGTGIGLSVVSDLVAMHGGRAWVEEPTGGGARFVIALPLADGGAEGDGGEGGEREGSFDGPRLVRTASA